MDVLLNTLTFVHHYKTSRKGTKNIDTNNISILTFRGPCIVIYSYNKTNEMHQFLNFIFGMELYMFRTVSLSIIKSPALYTQQQVYVIQVMLTACSYIYLLLCIQY